MACRGSAERGLCSTDDQFKVIRCRPSVRWMEGRGKHRSAGELFRMRASIRHRRIRRAASAFQLCQAHLLLLLLPTCRSLVRSFARLHRRNEYSFRSILSECFSGTSSTTRRLLGLTRGETVLSRNALIVQDVKITGKQKTLRLLPEFGNCKSGHASLIELRSPPLMIRQVCAG